MNQEKLQHLVTSKVNVAQKVKWLKLSNSTHALHMFFEISENAYFL